MSAPAQKQAYHHGDLRAAALRVAEARIAAEGASAITIRGIAAELGVSHTAIGHVFGSRGGLLTAIAVDGFRELATRLEAAEGAGLLALGLAYVRFGLERPAHFAVMFDADLIDATDDYREASDRTWRALAAGVEQLDDASRADDAGATVAAWSLVHGIVTLHATGALQRAGLVDEHDSDAVLAIAQRAARMLFGGAR